MTTAPASRADELAADGGTAASSRIELEAMLAAGEEILEWYRVLGRTKDNVVGEVLRHQGTFYEWKHYPKGDVYDDVSHSQYYYHAHKKGARGAEHGHFHTFLRAKGMPKDVAPVPYAGTTEWPKGDAALSHLIGISMDRAGHPITLFTTNRWVTGECWYRADDVVRMLDRFIIDHARPSWPTNRWVTAMIRLFKPVIRNLIYERDATLARHRATRPDTDIFEDRAVEVLSFRAISIDGEIAAVQEALGLRPR